MLRNRLAYVHLYVKPITRVFISILLLMITPSIVNAQTAIEWFNMGLDAFKWQEIDTATAYFARAMEADPLSPDYPFYMGLCYQQVDRFTDAEIAYGESLKLGGDTDLILFHRGNLRWSSGNIGKALEDYARVIEGQGASASPALLNKANLELNQGIYNKAVEDYEAYLQREPNAPDEDNIRKIMALIRSDIKAAERAEAMRIAEETKRVEEARQRQALISRVLESLEDSGENTQSIGAGSEHIREQFEESALDD